jgi:hypothetical protein
MATAAEAGAIEAIIVAAITKKKYITIKKTPAENGWSFFAQSHPPLLEFVG